MKKSYEPYEIVQILKGSDKKEIELATTYLYKIFRPIVKSYIKRQGGDNETGKDIFQEVILFFSRQVNTLKFEAKSRNEMESYFIKVAHYKWLKKQERDNRRSKLENEFLFERDVLSEIELPLTQIETDEVFKEFFIAFEQLGERCKCILKAYYVDELSIKEISEVYGFGNPSSVKVQKFRCLQKLKKELLKKR